MIAELILLSTVSLTTVTSYQPIPAQTKPECINRRQCETSIGDNITMFGCAVSQDMLKDKRVHYGDVLYIPEIGYRVINDVMAARHKNSVDVLVLSHEAEKKIGVRKLKVYVIKVLP